MQGLPVEQNYINYIPNSIVQGCSYVQLATYVSQASDLCPREHELGTHGLPRLCAFWNGRPCGNSEIQPSFPRPRWRPFSVSVGAPGDGDLLLKLVESDPLQPR